MTSMKHHGFTLVELLVAMAVTSLLMGGIISIFISTKQTYRYQITQSSLMEDGRYAMDVLSREIGRAGYFDQVNQYLPEIQAEGLGKGMYLNGSTSPVNGTEMDSIVFRYQLSKINPKDDLAGTLCLPFGLGYADGVTNPSARLDKENILVIKLFVDMDNTLKCRATIGGVDDQDQYQAGGTQGVKYLQLDGSNNYTGIAVSQPLVSNVERFRILYGIDDLDDSAPNFATQYRSSDWVNANGRWLDVVSIRLSLVIKSEETNIVSTPVKTITTNTGLVHKIQNPEQRRLYLQFGSVIPLKNRTL